MNFDGKKIKKNKKITVPFDSYFSVCMVESTVGQVSWLIFLCSDETPHLWWVKKHASGVCVEAESKRTKGDIGYDFMVFMHAISKAYCMTVC